MANADEWIRCDSTWIQRTQQPGFSNLQFGMIRSGTQGFKVELGNWQLTNRRTGWQAASRKTPFRLAPGSQIRLKGRKTGVPGG